MFTFEDIGNNSGYEALAPTTSTGITTSLLLPTSGNYKNMYAKAALINVETNPIRIKMDGNDPTATVGMLLPVGTFYTISNPANVKNFRCIDTGAGASSVKVLVFH